MMKYLHSPMKGGRCYLMLLLPVFLNAAVPSPRISPKNAATQEKPVIIGCAGSFRGQVNTDEIAARKPTHINYASVNVQLHGAALGNLATGTVNLRRLNGGKTLAPAGGWAWSRNFSDAVLTGTSRKVFAAGAQQNRPAFAALVLYENGGHHIAFSKAARIWLDQLAAQEHFTLTYLNNTDSINDTCLRKYQLFIQLDYAPYGWRQEAADAFKRYITEGRGGWIGFHHATLLGEFDGYPMWKWFSDFMGGIRFTDYIAGFANGKVTVEDKNHPVMTGITSPFIINKEEWYTYDKSPRPNVHVLASVDESSYVPASGKKMGDHPVVWTNEHVKARNIYIFMGHSPALLDNPVYVKLVRNAIFWAAGKE